MIPMMTKEEFEKAVEICTSADRNCGQCPLNKKIYKCGGYFARYMKTEPAPAATGTSSTKKENTFQIDDSTKSDICQAYKTADEACSNILTVYEGMSECEQRAFDIGEAYGKIFSTRDKLETSLKELTKEGENKCR